MGCECDYKCEGVAAALAMAMVMRSRLLPRSGPLRASFCCSDAIVGASSSQRNVVVVVLIFVVVVFILVSLIGGWMDSCYHHSCRFRLRFHPLFDGVACFSCTSRPWIWKWNTVRKWLQILVEEFFSYSQNKYSVEI